CADYRHLHVIDHTYESGLTFVADTARTRAELAQVKADTEGTSRAGDNDYADVRIAPQLLHRIAERQSEFTVEGIELIRPVEGDGGNPVPLIDEDYRLTHFPIHSYCSSLRFARHYHIASTSILPTRPPNTA